MRYGSDLIVEHLAALGIELVTLNPGATIRGLHDSLVRNDDLEMLLALHEETAVGMAHGYWKSAGKPAAVFLHDLVGLQHASMALFNAWVDCVPMLVIGGSGPRDAANRRPWIDWVHTGLPQGALVRDVVKWDDEPGSLEAVPESLERALETALRGPYGPVYVSIDVAIQEMEAGDVVFPTPPTIAPTTLAAPTPTVEQVADLVRAARRPVAVVDLPQRGLSAALADLAERTGLRVVDLAGGANFPSDHWANHTYRRKDVMAEADLVLTLDVRDVLWAVTTTDQRTRAVTPLTAPGTPVVGVTLQELQMKGFVAARSYVSEAMNVVGDPVQLVRDVTASLVRSGHAAPVEVAQEVAQSPTGSAQARAKVWEQAREHATGEWIHPAHLAASLWDAVSDGPWQLVNRPIGEWVQKMWDLAEDGHYLGQSGGQGLGYGVPATLGAAYAQKDSDTLVVSIQGDGDLMYTASAFWTAARYQLPMLVVVNNNRTYGKDELHQREIAHTRGRSEDVVGVGIELDRPNIDYVALARSQGVDGVGPITDPAELPAVLREAARIVREERRPYVVDVVCPLPPSQGGKGTA